MLQKKPEQERSSKGAGEGVDRREVQGIESRIRGGSAGRAGQSSVDSRLQRFVWQTRRGAGGAHCLV